jgi:hypothetical protein
MVSPGSSQGARSHLEPLSKVPQSPQAHAGRSVLGPPRSPSASSTGLAPLRRTASSVNGGGSNHGGTMAQQQVSAAVAALMQQLHGRQYHTSCPSPPATCTLPAATGIVQCHPTRPPHACLAHHADDTSSSHSSHAPDQLFIPTIPLALEPPNFNAVHHSTAAPQRCSWSMTSSPPHPTRSWTRVTTSRSSCECDPCLSRSWTSRARAST